MTDETEYPTSIRLKSDLRAALKQLADDDGRSLNNYIVNVLRSHVDKAGKGSGKSRKD
jgi:hypothetical protein